MTSLQQLLAAALDSSSSDNELAKALVDSGALEEIVRLGTYDDATVQRRLEYGSGAGLRAAVSKSRRGKGAFPLPVLEGRRWSRRAVESYNNDRRRRSSTAAPPLAHSDDTSSTPPDSTATPNGGITPTTSNRRIASSSSYRGSASSADSASFGSGTGAAPSEEGKH